MTRRGFLAALFALPFAPKPELKPEPKILYMDTDSIVYDGWPSEAKARPDLVMDIRRYRSNPKVQFVFKMQLSSAYGKFASSE